MRLRLSTRSARQRALVEAAVSAYTQWRRECDAVRDAYRRWVSASKVDKPFAFAAYRAALDNEDHAARRYARLMLRAGRLREIGPAHQLAQIEASYGGC
jgi:hypothetical protein